MGFSVAELGDDGMGLREGRWRWKVVRLVNGGEKVCLRVVAEISV